MIPNLDLFLFPSLRFGLIRSKAVSQSHRERAKERVWERCEGEMRVGEGESVSIRQINLSEGRSFGVLGIPIPNATMISYLLVAVQGEGGVGSDRGIVSGV